jgi:hypothetical protein
MYDLPQGIAFDFLKGQELELLCIGPHSVALHFEEGIQIKIEGLFEHMISGQGANRVTYSYPISASQLLRLPIKRVTEISTKRDGTLLLGFENGDALVIEDNAGPYESYNIACPSRDLIVV